MKFLRLILASSLLSGLILAQIPAPASCQMSFGLPSTLCSMPCCKTHRLPVQCPNLRQAASPDAIEISSMLRAPEIETLSLLGIEWAAVPTLKVSPVRFLIQTITSLFTRAAPIVRAPPSDCISTAA